MYSQQLFPKFLPKWQKSSNLGEEPSTSSSTPGHTSVFSPHRAPAQTLPGSRKHKGSSTEDTASMFRLNSENICLCIRHYDQPSSALEQWTSNQCCAGWIQFFLRLKSSMNLKLRVFQHAFAITVMHLWGSGLHIMLTLVIETGYPIGDWLLLLNSLPDPRGKLQVCLNLQQLSAVPLESGRK